MEVAERRQLLRASEKPLRATGSGQEAASGEPGSIDPAGGESGHGGADRRIVRRSCSRSSMPCMPVVSQGGNQVTWNHFYLGRERSLTVAAGIEDEAGEKHLPHRGSFTSVGARCAGMGFVASSHSGTSLSHR